MRATFQAQQQQLLPLPAQVGLLQLVVLVKQDRHTCCCLQPMQVSVCMQVVAAICLHVSAMVMAASTTGSATLTLQQLRQQPLVVMLQLLLLPHLEVNSSC